MNKWRQRFNMQSKKETKKIIREIIFNGKKQLNTNLRVTTTLIILSAGVDFNAVAATA